MEFKKAMRIWRRMCKEHRECKGCPVKYECARSGFTDSDESKIEATLAKWAKEHPEKTIADDFFEKHPKAPKTDAGVPYACAVDIGYSMPSSCHREMDCCAECWRRPLEEVEV